MPLDVPVSLPLHLLPCGTCGSPLKPTQINMSHQMWLCADQKCSYPLNTPHAFAFLVPNPVLLPQTTLTPDEKERIQQHKQECKTNEGETKYTAHHTYSTPTHSHSITRTSALSAPSTTSTSNTSHPPVRSASSALAALRKGRSTTHTTRTTSIASYHASTTPTSTPIRSTSAVASTHSPLSSFNRSNSQLQSPSLTNTVAPSPTLQATSTAQSNPPALFDFRSPSMLPANSSGSSFETSGVQFPMLDYEDGEHHALQQQLDQYHQQQNQAMSQSEVLWD